MIKLSKKWSYALRAILFIAKKDELLKVSDISNELNISLWMLRRIIAELEKGGILITIKWRNWWVKIWKKLDEISIYDILYSSWEELSIRDCTKWIICDNKSNCSTTWLLKWLQKWFNTLLKINTLDKLVKK
jgi:Rrf2 family protein